MTTKSSRAYGTSPVASPAVAIADPLLPTRPYHPKSVAADWGIRLGRCVAGLFLFGFGIALIIEADLGLAPWDVFHQGVAKKLGVPVGTVIILSLIHI